MNIVIYTPSARIGGVQIWSFTYFQELLKQGQSVSLFAGKSGLLINSLTPIEKEKITVGSFTKLILYLTNNNIDVVHFPSQAIDIGAGFIKKLFPKIKVIVTCHGAIPIGWSSKNCDQIISLSKWLCAPSSRISGMKVPYIYNGIDFNKFNASGNSKKVNGKPIVVWVGRADDEIKGLRVLTNIIDDIKKLGFDIWIITPSKRHELKDKSLLKIANKADVWKSVEYINIPNVFRNVANLNGLLLMTSKREGLGLVAIEAQACGCPVIGPNHTGIQEAVIDKKLLYNSESEILSLIQSLYLVSSPEIKRGRALSTEVAKIFDLEKMTSCYIEYYKACFKSKLKASEKNDRTLNEKVRGIIARVKYENYSFRKKIFINTLKVVEQLKEEQQLVLSTKLKIQSFMHLFFIPRKK
jgi:glycosyltransferase involved in cell wall biosynthesis